MRARTARFHCSARDLDAIAGLCDVDELLEGVERDGVRRIALGDVLRRLLKPHHLRIATPPRARTHSHKRRVCTRGGRA